MGFLQHVVRPVSPIVRLSQSLINQIAAGEVIERPASVVKELMENAVDAGATRIDVAVVSGGLELVRVVDNGCGIPADQLELAVASHATSKLQGPEDLYRVGTLGFRGEALASIAEVSRMTLRSRPAEAEAGAQIEVVGGRASPVVPCGCPPGTAVEVRQLFFNTPVRRKFLRSVQTELGHTSEAFIRIALAQPNVHLTLRHNERVLFDLPASEGWLQRIGRVVGRRLAEQLIWVESSDGPVCVAGYVAHPSHSRSHSRMQYLFLNGRYIRDRALSHALAEAYRGLLTTGRYPIAILRLEMPPEMVDVNVHPTKLEVRFQDSGRLYSQLLSTLRTKFLSTDLTTRIDTAPDEDPAGAHDAEEARRLRQQVVDWARGEAPTASGPPR
ncbi:MAG TPA: DNA mismatch repair endonuclease MutL, partial [Planctomycetes bacterium]|nr:DNA mismatch repair endonuclease MutL [Planctomycetota bacterium]